jgi:hypothetical protein
MKARFNNSKRVQFSELPEWATFITVSGEAAQKLPTVTRVDSEASHNAIIHGRNGERLSYFTADELVFPAEFELVEV